MKRLTQWSIFLKILLCSAIILGLVILEIRLVSYFGGGKFWEVFTQIEPLSIVFSAMAFFVIYLTLVHQNKTTSELRKREYLERQESRFMFFLEILKEHIDSSKGEIRIDQSNRQTFSGLDFLGRLWGEIRFLHDLFSNPKTTTEDKIRLSKGCLNQYLAKIQEQNKFIDEYNSQPYKFGIKLTSIMLSLRLKEINRSYRTFKLILTFLDKELVTMKSDEGFDKREVEKIIENYLSILKLVVDDYSCLIFLYFGYILVDSQTKLTPVQKLLFEKIPDPLFLKGDYEIIVGYS